MLLYGQSPPVARRNVRKSCPLEALRVAVAVHLCCLDSEAKSLQALLQMSDLRSCLVEGSSTSVTSLS